MRSHFLNDGDAHPQALLLLTYNGAALPEEIEMDSQPNELARMFLKSHAVDMVVFGRMGHTQCDFFGEVNSRFHQKHGPFVLSEMEGTSKMAPSMLAVDQEDKSKSLTGKHELGQNRQPENDSKLDKDGGRNETESNETVSALNATNQEIGRRNAFPQALNDMFESSIMKSSMSWRPFKSQHRRRHHNHHYRQQHFNQDLSIGKCGNLQETATTFVPELFGLMEPTPGEENRCPGLKFILEEHTEYIAGNNTSNGSLLAALMMAKEPRTITCNGYLPLYWHLISNQTQVTAYKEQLYLNFTVSMTASCHFMNYPDYSYKRFSKQLTPQCKTLKEITVQIDQLFPPDEARVLMLFMTNVSQVMPPSLATGTDFMKWSKGALGGFVAGGIAGSLAAFGMTLPLLKSALLKVLSLISKIGSFLDAFTDFLDALSDLFGGNDDNNTPDDVADTADENSNVTETTTTTPTSTTTRPNDICLLKFGQTHHRVKRSPPDYCKCMLSETPNVGECGQEEWAELTSLEELSRQDIEWVAYAYDAKNEADLILSRAGIFFDDWDFEDRRAEYTEKKYICKKHVLQLGPQWHMNRHLFAYKYDQGKRKLACMWKTVEGSAEHASSVLTRNRYVSREESKVLLAAKEMFIPVGTREYI